VGNGMVEGPHKPMGPHTLCTAGQPSRHRRADQEVVALQRLLLLGRQPPHDRLQLLEALLGVAQRGCLGACLLPQALLHLRSGTKGGRGYRVWVSTHGVNMHSKHASCGAPWGVGASGAWG
jgi:hypothetical protein